MDSNLYDYDASRYEKYFRSRIAFKSVKGAGESLEQIKRLYLYFERIGDRAGQHHCEVLALTGRNRARWSGHLKAAKVFEEWLFNH